MQLANERMRSNKLTGTDSAQSYLMSARSLDRTDPGVQAGVATLAGMLQSLVQKATNEKRLEDANRWMQAAIEIRRERRPGRGHAGGHCGRAQRQHPLWTMRSS